MHMLSTIGRRVIAGVAITVTSALALTACSGAPTSSTSGTASKAATATSLADIGSMSDLVSAAKAEGALNVIALPRDWADYGEIIDLFKSTYPGNHRERAVARLVQRGRDPGCQDQRRPRLGPRRLRRRSDRGPAEHLDVRSVQGVDLERDPGQPEGLQRSVHRRLRRLHVDRLRLGQVPGTDHLNDLLDAKYKGAAVALNGDPTQAGAAFAAVGLPPCRAVARWTTSSPASDFFSKMKAAGNLLKVDVTTATVTSGETPVVFDWDYLNATHVKDKPSWKVTILPGTGYAAYYNQAINKQAAHPAAARPVGVVPVLRPGAEPVAEGRRPSVRMDAMTKAGTSDKTYAAKLPTAPTKAVVPTAAQSDAAGKAARR